MPLSESSEQESRGGLNFFFSSSVADVALMARSLHVSKQTKHCTRDKKVLRISKSIKQRNEKHNHTKNDDPQIPQPDLRFASGNSEANSRKQTKTQKTGPEPKQKHPPNRFAIGTQWQIHCITTQKHAKDELCIAAVQADMKTLARNLTQA